MEKSWILARGVHDLGIGFFAHLQNGGPGPELRMAGMTIDSNSTSSSSSSNNESAGAKENIATARASVHKTLDCQTFIVSLFTKELEELCHHLQLLEGPLSEEMDAMIRAADNEHSARAVRDFRAKVDSATLAYEPLVERIVKAAESTSRKFPSFALRDAAKAETNANALYSWARTFIPKATDDQGDTDKAAKLRMMPYLVAMAYAIRIKLDVYYVESSAVDKSERLEFLERTHSTVDQFMATLEVAMGTMLTSSSLLDVALDYHLAMTTYVALSAALRTSVQLMLAPQNAPKVTREWDDGLAQVRTILRRADKAPDTAATTIQLDSVQECIWWARFAGDDLNRLKPKDLRETVSLRELLFIMGAISSDASHPDESAVAATALRLAPDYKGVLLQLPPASSLRSTLHTKLVAIVAAVLNVSTPPPIAPDSIGRIRNARDLDLSLSSSLSSSLSPPALTPRLSQTLTGHSNTLRGVALCADNTRLVSCSDDTTAKVWSLTTGQTLGTFTKHSSFVFCIAIFPDGKRVVTGGYDSIVRIWSVDSRNEQSAFAGHSEYVLRVAVTPDGCTVASASGDKTIRLWEVYGGQCKALLTGHSGRVRCVTFSPDGKTLASGSEDTTIRTWTVGAACSGTTIANGHTGIVTAVAFTPDGERLVSGSADETIKVCKWRTGEVERTFAAHTDQVWCVAIFPDGERIASCGSDKTVRIWNLCNGELEHTLKEHAQSVRTVAVSRDGRTIASGSDDNLIKVWTLFDD